MQRGDAPVAIDIVPRQAANLAAAHGRLDGEQKRRPYAGKGGLGRGVVAIAGCDLDALDFLRRDPAVARRRLLRAANVRHRVALKPTPFLAGDGADVPDQVHLTRHRRPRYRPEPAVAPGSQIGRGQHVEADVRQLIPKNKGDAHRLPPRPLLRGTDLAFVALEGVRHGTAGGGLRLAAAPSQFLFDLERPIPCLCVARKALGEAFAVDAHICAPHIPDMPDRRHDQPLAA